MTLNLASPSPTNTQKKFFAALEANVRLYKDRIPANLNLLRSLPSSCFKSQESNMSDSQQGLNIFQLMIYFLLTGPVFCNFIYHGLHGILGWLSLVMFCILRVIGGVQSLANPENSTAAIISGIGICPLLLAVAGVLHEARRHRHPFQDKKVALVLILAFQLIAVTGLALVASGSASLKQAGAVSKGDENLLKGGITILLSCWIIVCGWALGSLSKRKVLMGTLTEKIGTKLLYTVLIALPFVGIRVFYSIVAIFAPTESLNALHGALGIKLGLSFVPELLATMILMLGGLITKGIFDIEHGLVGRDVFNGHVDLAEGNRVNGVALRGNSGARNV